MARGDLLIGSFANGQVGWNRPFPGAGTYRTPVPGLYLCGGSTHPGGNVTGLCGYNAARVIAADTGKAIWWQPPDLERALHERYHPVITGLRRLPKPVVSAVQGPCVGVGLSLALCADLVYATENAYFLLAFVNIGLVPDGGSSAFIPARIGLARAAEMAMLGERVDAAKAADWGLINGVFEAETFDGEIDELSGRLAGGPTRSYAGSKRQLNNWIFGPLDDQLALEASLQQEMASSSDFAEGVVAFVQKRATSFTGR